MIILGFAGLGNLLRHMVTFRFGGSRRVLLEGLTAIYESVLVGHFDLHEGFLVQN